MIDSRWLFPALTAALVTGIILGSQLWLSLLLLYLLFRVWTLHDFATIKWVLLAGLTASLVCGCALYNAQTKPLTTPQPVECNFKVLPDQIIVNGNLVQMQGTNLNSGERESVVLRLRSSQEKARWFTTKPCCFGRSKAKSSQSSVLPILASLTTKSTNGDIISIMRFGHKNGIGSRKNRIR